MEKAILKVKTGELSGERAAELYCIPQRTLGGRIQYPERIAGAVFKLIKLKELVAKLPPFYSKLVLEKQKKSEKTQIENVSDPQEEAKLSCGKNEDPDGFKLAEVNPIIGKGVFTTKVFAKNDFLLEYKGELISNEEGIKRHEKYGIDKGCFIYFFEHNIAGNKHNIKYCIDATEDCHLARYVNDSKKKPNCKMKKVMVRESPHLCLFAIKDIDVGTELRYDYMDDGKLWWRNFIEYKTPYQLPKVDLDDNEYDFTISDVKEIKEEKKEDIITSSPIILLEKIPAAAAEVVTSKKSLNFYNEVTHKAPEKDSYQNVNIKKFEERTLNKKDEYFQLITVEEAEKILFEKPEKDEIEEPFKESSYFQPWGGGTFKSQRKLLSLQEKKDGFQEKNKSKESSQEKEGFQNKELFDQPSYNKLKIERSVME
ncbi:uncharacterized protein LOC136092753 [Hydra vulgaris]|uniref:uncharacterized protein LOC136092753 n=1 Tax=Hydra vulgaris TaxID=6087 RepID=UPI0032EA0E09